MNGHTAYKMVVKVVSDLGAVGEILEEVETEVSQTEWRDQGYYIHSFPFP